MQNKPIPTSIANRLNSLDESIDMRIAITNNIFYAEPVPCMSSKYHIGTIDDDLPRVFATLDEAKRELADSISMFNESERDEDDEYEGFVCKARFCEEDPNYMLLIDMDGSLLCRERIHDLCGTE